MVNLVDSDATSIVGNLAELTQGLDKAVADSKADPEDKPDTRQRQDDSDKIPAKLRGKSLDEIVDMYQNLESAHGRMANDLGQQRTLTDRLLGLKRDEDLQRGGAKTPKVEVTSAELLEKPTEALERFSSARETALVQNLNDRLAQVERATVEAVFTSKHPDAQQIANSTEFRAWVQKSRIRQRTAGFAARGDFGAADDLLTEWKDNQSRRTEDKEVTNQRKDNLAAARRATLETGAETGGEDSGRGKDGRQYSRAALMKLRTEDPEKYYSDDYQNVILQAYAEGRVK